jgi:hypothetical protein
MTFQGMKMVLVAGLILGRVPARAENAMGYRLLSAEEAMKLPSHHGSLGMSIARSRQITDGGMTFDIIRIEQIRAGSAAARAGLHVDDQIIAVDDRVFPSPAIFGKYIDALTPGSRARVDYVPTGGGPANAQRVTVQVGAGTPSVSSAGSPTSDLTTGQKVAIGVGAAALLGCYEMGSSALTGTDPLSLMKADPADARLLVSERGGATSGGSAKRSSALVSFFVRREDRFFAPAYVSDRDARSGGQARSGATRGHAQRPIASMARIASTGP